MKSPGAVLWVSAVGVLVVLFSGCSSTMKLSGTPGVQFTGHYTAGGVSTNVSGLVPATLRTGVGALESCEFTKMSPGGDLILVVHRGLFTGSVMASEGTAGVRAQRKGMLYDMECVP